MVMTPRRAPPGEGQPPHRPRSRRYPTNMSQTRRSEERSLFTIAEAAADLGISPETLRTAARVGTLSVERINPRLNMVTREAIEAYRREHLGRQGRPKGAKNKPKGTPKGTPPARARAAAHHPIDDEGHTQTEPPHERE